MRRTVALHATVSACKMSVGLRVSRMEWIRPRDCLTTSGDDSPPSRAASGGRGAKDEGLSVQEREQTIQAYVSQASSLMSTPSFGVATKAAGIMMRMIVDPDLRTLRDQIQLPRYSWTANPRPEETK